jgi:hypothetical protein
MEALSGKWFLFEWSRPESFRRAKLTISSAQPADSGATRVKKTEDSVSTTVKNAINCESKLLYEVLLGGLEPKRKHGDIWSVDGETLGALIHSSFEGYFRGKVLVKCEVINGESPVRTIEEMNGFRLKFVQRAKVDGRTQFSNLQFVFKTTDEGEYITIFNMDDKKSNGELWLDVENQCLRYGNITVKEATYDGYLPKIGKLNAKVKLRADLNFEFTYKQNIGIAEKNHKTTENK